MNFTKLKQAFFFLFFPRLWAYKRQLEQKEQIEASLLLRLEYVNSELHKWMDVHQKFKSAVEQQLQKIEEAVATTPYPEPLFWAVAKARQDGKIPGSFDWARAEVRGKIGTTLTCLDSVIIFDSQFEAELYANSKTLGQLFGEKAFIVVPFRPVIESKKQTWVGGKGWVQG